MAAPDLRPTGTAAAALQDADPIGATIFSTEVSLNLKA